MVPQVFGNQDGLPRFSPPNNPRQPQLHAVETKTREIATLAGPSDHQLLQRYPHMELVYSITVAHSRKLIRERDAALNIICASDRGSMLIDRLCSEEGAPGPEKVVDISIITSLSS